MRDRRVFLGRILCLCCCMAVLWLVPAGVEARLVIPLDTPKVGRMPIGIPDFKVSGEASVDGRAMAMILRNDLYMTGLFEIVENAPTPSGTSTDEPDFDAWAKAGVQTLVTGTVAVTGNELIFDGRLYHVTLRKLEMGKRFRCRVPDHRLAIHRFGDRIMEKLTDLVGSFCTQIAFVAASKPGEIYVMDFDGHNLRQATRTGTINLSPRWSPDGRGILFTSYLNRNPDLWFQGLQSGKLHLVSGRKGLNASGRYSPDGRSIAASLSVEGIPKIFLLTPEGHIMNKLTHGRGNDISPTWSPDGSTLAYVSDQAGTPHIYTIPSQGGQPRRLTFQSNYNTDPDWSPMGDMLAFTARIGGRFQICTMRTDGTGFRVLTDKGSNQTPTWSPDGRMIAFSSDRDGTGRIYVMDGGGEVQTPVSPIAGKSPAWSRTSR
ncbi:MAG: Tol-Pal system beta propeller repeat protein TolB [Thermodesulfobacteriota bacterium]